MLVPSINASIKNTSRQDEIVIESIKEHADFYQQILTEKERIKFIKYVEKLVRGSFEYRSYIRYLKQELDLTKCSFLTNIDIKECKKVSLEFHHYPFTLYDIVDIVTKKYESENDMLNPFMISKEVMELHYRNLVGLVPLSLTVHQLVHEGMLFIKDDLVYGNYNEFKIRYNKYINEDFITKLQEIESRTDKINKGLENWDLEVLNVTLNTIKINDIDDAKPILIEKPIIA